MISIIKKSADTLFKLSETSLLITELQAGNYKIYFSQIELNSFIKNIADSVSKDYDIQINMVYGFNPLLIYYNTDSFLFNKLIYIILDNAVYHSLNNVNIRIIVNLLGFAISIEVIDSGKGFSDYILNHLFELFITEDVRHKSRGFGLGLATAKLIVEKLGGEISICNTESSNGKVNLVLQIQS